MIRKLFKPLYDAFFGNHNDAIFDGLDKTIRYSNNEKYQRKVISFYFALTNTLHFALLVIGISFNNALSRQGHTQRERSEHSTRVSVLNAIRRSLNKKGPSITELRPKNIRQNPICEA